MSDAAPARSWMKIALGVSVAANLFLVGLVGGKVFSAADPDAATDAPPPATATQGYSLHPRVMLRAMPEDRHDDIRAFYATAREGVGREWRAITEIRREVDATLRAEPFDEAAYLDARRREAQARMDLQMRSHAKLGDFLDTMTPQERLALADYALGRLDEQSAYWRERARKRREAEGR